MPKFTVEDQEIEAHMQFTTSSRIQFISGIGRVLAQECTGCGQMKLVGNFYISARGLVKSKCKKCIKLERKKKGRRK
ncbi:MAG: hypothetical protein PWR19_312 [Carnobacterium sp.]|uniref:hypothetical protein n=1 Tax=Carnobacterium sp. TaxID=48221 RepID=UPI00264872C9|nr:hypothetical protein [Carnobacterium sp.]MDN5371266.1 hypothetical protein [Carnobacterium sp.]